MRICLDNFAEPLSVPALLFARQNPTGFMKLQFGASKTYLFVHGRGGMMLKVEEWNNLVLLLQRENGTTQVCGSCTDHHASDLPL